MAQLAAPSVRGRPRSVQHLFHGGPFSIVQKKKKKKKKKHVCADFRGLLLSRAASALVFSEGFLQAEEKEKVSKQKNAYSPCFGGLSV